MPGTARRKQTTKRQQRRRPRQADSEDVLTPAAFLRKKNLAGDLNLKLSGDTVEATHLDKVLWPDEGYTKADLIRYYLRVSRYIMPYLKDRPAILQRFPDGLAGEGFYQQNVENAPPFLKTERLRNQAGRTLDYAVYTEVASLIYLVNLGTIAQNPWHSRVEQLDRPDYIVFDLDPHGALFANVLKVALTMKEVLKDLGLKGYPKTSGSSGVHIYVPLRPKYEYEEAAAFAERVSVRVAESVPEIATVERRLAARKKGQVYVDSQQNARGKSAASVYSVRAKPGATVSTPITWQEVKRGVEIGDFTIRTVPRRLKTGGDLWREMLTNRQGLPRIPSEH
jgi:bifunctional non-homologous end joining protein LigD